MINIAICNESTVLTDAEVEAVVPALQIQVSEHFFPAWGKNAKLTFVPKGQQADPSFWQLVILDNSDQAGALGYHDTNVSGLPLGKCFAKSDLDYKLSWTVTLSHELLEMLADPEINLTVLKQDSQGSGTLYAYEVCDACEDDRFAYEINGVKVSDFVYPAWFEQMRPAKSTQFDYKGYIEAPFQLIRGGYIGVYHISSGNGWTQVTDEKITENEYRHRPPVGSRRDRRRTPKHQWMKSTK